MNSKLHLLLFSAAIFILTAIGLIVFYLGRLVLTFWLILAYIIAYPCIFAIFIPQLTSEGKLNGKKILLLTLSITLISITATSSVWTLITPNWSFSVATDKSSYKLGEDVKITITLKNAGYITHSFKSAVSNPILVSVEYQYSDNPTQTYQVWYSPFHRSMTEFSVGPNESLERTFIWNQTNTANPWFWNQTYTSGTYEIVAWIQDAKAEIEIPGAHTLFIAYTSINVTSS